MPLGDEVGGQRAGERRQRGAYGIQAGDLTGIFYQELFIAGVSPALNTSPDRLGDDQRHALLLYERHGLKRSQDSVLVDGFECGHGTVSAAMVADRRIAWYAATAYNPACGSEG